MDNRLAGRFTFGSLLCFAIPNVLMMLSLSMYIIIDGMFIARLLGTTALAAANIVYPAVCLEMAAAIMISTGGSAIIARKAGQGRQKEARRNLTFLIIVEFLLGVAAAAAGNLFVGEIVSFLGAGDRQAALCVSYGGVLFAFAPAFFLQTAFQTFLVTAGRPALGLTVTLLAGGTNIALDYIFMACFDMGIAGAALATGLGYCIPAAVGLAFFFAAKRNPLRFTRPQFDLRVLTGACANGSSEMITNLANAAVTFLFNYMFLQYYGEDGVAAITIILYFQYLFTALYFGYANGIAPVVSYKYGSGDRKQLKSIFRSSILFLVLSSLISNLLVRMTITRSVAIFTPVDSGVYKIAVQGFFLYAPAFLIMGFGIFASALFTALSDGKTSAVISFSRTFLFIIGAVLILPAALGETGLWTAVPAAELAGMLVALFVMLKKRRQGRAF